jgi:hypothetical protein
MSLLLQIFNQTHTADYLTAKSVTTTYTYKPADPEEQQAIMNGNIPQPLGVLIQTIKIQESLEVENLHWVTKGPFGPFIVLDIIEKIA